MAQTLWQILKRQIMQNYILLRFASPWDSRRVSWIDTLTDNGSTLVEIFCLIYFEGFVCHFYIQEPSNWYFVSIGNTISYLQDARTSKFNLRLVAPNFTEQPNFWGAFWALSNNYNGAFCKNNYNLKSVKYF